ncbi:hypothetical protein I7X12_02285 [Halosimplex litoreum]|uniref:C2H2-type domain-containing protein n=1 Tax=Halosimplex litoreum TaxID=1198301 RepID=A0A7T3FZ93_9EURY|nr:hypothetical protein [Halosimplex litoreum]QPV63484.1 hypothetical protein I7X12_02285 [Halosimplex litoreum]
MHHGQLTRVLEFFVVGIVFGVTEDVLAVLIATDAELSAEIVGVVVVIAIPFAVLSELIVDHPKFLTFERLSTTIRSLVSGRPAHRPDDAPGNLHVETAPRPHHQYFCDSCAIEFETGAILQEHLDRRHPDVEIRWSIHAAERSR